MISQAEENYLKAIFKLSEKSDKPVSTNAISKEMKTAAASVTDMIKRLSKNGYVFYERYKGAELTPEGDKVARNLIRKHRLWEVFLYEKLDFTWDEVHDVAEQLEHIHSEQLVNRLEEFLGFPRFDPHGDPIPDRDGKFAERQQSPLTEWTPGTSGVIVGIREHSKPFLAYLEQLNLLLGTYVEVIEIFDFDGSVKIKVGTENAQTVTQKAAYNIFVQKSDTK